MSVSEEASGVGFDLLEAESGTSVSPVCQDTGSEGTGQTSIATTNHVGIIADWKRIWESDARWP